MSSSIRGWPWVTHKDPVRWPTKTGLNEVPFDEAMSLIIFLTNSCRISLVQKPIWQQRIYPNWSPGLGQTLRRMAQIGSGSDFAFWNVPVASPNVFDRSFLFTLRWEGWWCMCVIDLISIDICLKQTHQICGWTGSNLCLVSVLRESQDTHAKGCHGSRDHGSGKGTSGSEPGYNPVATSLKQWVETWESAPSASGWCKLTIHPGAQPLGSANLMVATSLVKTRFAQDMSCQGLLEGAMTRTNVTWQQKLE